VLGILFSSPLAFFILIGSLVLSLTIHEFCHALAADKLGDPTPRSQGRLSLNPARHLDPLGTIFLVMFGFGWGKPVMFDPYNLRQPVRDAAIISAAGPLSNIVLAVILAQAMPWLPIPGEIVYFLIRINLILAVFNLIPVHPLDGGKVLTAFLPRDLAIEFDQTLNRYGMLILLLLILPLAGGTAPIAYLVGPIVSFLMSLIL
jgi:Zn-dependent protease